VGKVSRIIRTHQAQMLGDDKSLSSPSQHTMRAGVLARVGDWPGTLPACKPGQTNAYIPPSLTSMGREGELTHRYDVDKQDPLHPVGAAEQATVSTKLLGSSSCRR
jgi:hypothetical protein